MKIVHSIIILIFIQISSGIFAQNGKASTTRKTYSRETTVSIDIKANEAKVWALLTNAVDYPRWNSTVTSIKGNIALGEKIRLKSVLDAKRTFKLKVKEFEVNKRMVWADKQGKRVYTITKNPNGSVLFTMTEKIGGFMFPLYAKKIPPFDSTFEQFARDLKKEAEKI
jgi:uncharacterized protein YndB with AHSA1/START domain